ncbi:hypothetical protein BVC80_9039g48 [Macleaya cordata]|uniref:Uncharacterized protein n=1 Tax=Macleaya cordata TaxID=56857 RepID=A0A200QYF2_MACCD|nr:hypothetical protein BVC80_9039g48 [Macleaya cordata]
MTLASILGSAIHPSTSQQCGLGSSSLCFILTAPKGSDHSQSSAQHIWILPIELDGVLTTIRSRREDQPTCTDSMESENPRIL